MFALCDCNNFYVAAERLFRPDLQNRPVVVLSNNDSCVIARSAEAKALGICMGEPEFRIRPLLVKHHVYVCSSNYTLYADLSDRVMSVLRRYFEKVDNYSIDEAFVKLDDSECSVSYLTKVAREVRKLTGIPLSIGASATMTLAKVASHLAKKGSGVHVLVEEGEIATALQDFPIENLWGIGESYYGRLRSAGVRTAFQLRSLPENYLRKQFTVRGQQLFRELWCEPAFSLKDVLPPPKVVSVSQSFAVHLSNPEGISGALTSFAWRVAEKLRAERLCCTVLEVFLATDKHRADYGRHFPVHRHRLSVASSDAHTITAAAVRIGKMLLQPGTHYRKAGVCASGLVPENGVQLNLFHEQNPARAALSAAADSVNRRFGHDTVYMASRGETSSWQMKRNHLSPQYTTSWTDIIKVN